MIRNPVPTTIEYDADGLIVGWVNAFGKYRLNKGITTRIGEGNVTHS